MLLATESKLRDAVGQVIDGEEFRDALAHTVRMEIIKRSAELTVSTFELDPTKGYIMVIPKSAGLSTDDIRTALAHLEGRTNLAVVIADGVKLLEMD